MGDEIEVLVVDEDPDVLELTETFLHRESDRIAVTTEESANDAAEALTDGQFDCVVSDFQMPEMNGMELFEQVREDRPDIPFFLFTAAATAETGEDASEAGVTAFIQKGAGTDHYTELAEKIEAAVD